MKAKKQIKKLKEALAEQRSLLKDIHESVVERTVHTSSENYKVNLVSRRYEEKPNIIPYDLSMLTKDVLRGITEPKLEDALVKSTPYVEETKPFVSTEVSTEPTATSTESLNLADVQVNVGDCSEEEIKELADIFVANGFEIDNSYDAFEVRKKTHHFYLQFFNGVVGVYRNYKETTLTPSQFREMFGKKEIDWSKAGQLVESDILIVMTCRVTKDNHVFTGVVVKVKDPDCGFYFKGYYSTLFDRSAFTLCTEPITLNN